MEQNKEAMGYIFKIATILCLVCAALVSIAAVGLKGIQDKNVAKEKMRNILLAADLYDADKDIVELYSGNIEAKIIDLKTGDFDDSIDLATFDAKKAAKRPESSIKLGKDDDTANIRQVAKNATVYLQKTADGIDKVILPIHGYGLWGTMYGFLAVDKDGETIKGISFYDHKETPGLGGEIVNPTWQASWVDKKGYNASQQASIKLVKGGINPDPQIAQHQIDSLAGATLTSRGVQNTINFWLGENGYKPFLTKLKSQ